MFTVVSGHQKRETDMISRIVSPIQIQDGQISLQAIILNYANLFFKRPE
jgi:hypothetical protein